jgi:hypothetical protein
MGLLSWFFEQVDNRPETGFALKPDPPPVQSCAHDWEEVSREGLGYDGGDPTGGGKGEYWYLVTYRCRNCSETKSEETT